MFRKIVRHICEKIYVIGKHKFQENQAIQNLIGLNKKATIHPEAEVRNAIIHNRLNDKERIIIGKNTQIRGELEVCHSKSQIVIGDHSYVGPGTRIYSSKKITIGSRVLISHNVNIYDNNTHPLDSALRHEDFIFILKNGYQSDKELDAKEIIIEDDVWIGFHSIILKGVRIGKGSIIGAGTTVTKDVPQFTVIAGNPAVFIKKST